ncbi:MAG: hypothetical protein BWX88_01559 [Planctomycetes bacterium ADurb.Bin126]|nr:MAG: hypothetical protein BWX88_01559 [Planctomycetes bacterium ADurb.Bin126]HOD80394.1 hypothetical protein [Phycisphaerae bacterium]HQL74425.1 hypothetical protein [Phycisphaerae bacterium]
MPASVEQQRDFMRMASWILCILTVLTTAWVFFSFYQGQDTMQKLVADLGPQAPPLSAAVAAVPALAAAGIALFLVVALILKEVVVFNTTITVIVNITVFLLVVFLYMVVQESQTVLWPQVLEQMKNLKNIPR